MKKPFLQFAVNDHLTDLNLRSCHPYAAGVWGYMLCIMAQGTPYGHLSIEGGADANALPGGVPGGTPLAPPDPPPGVTPPGLAQTADAEAYQLPENGSLEPILHTILGMPRSHVAWSVAHLETHGVFSRTAEGIIYSRRMVRDDEKHKKKVARAVAAYRRREEAQRRRRTEAAATGQPATPDATPGPTPPGTPPGTPQPGPHGLVSAPRSSRPGSGAPGRPGGVPSGPANQNQNQSYREPIPPTPLPVGKGGRRSPRPDVSSQAVAMMDRNRKAKK